MMVYAWLRSWSPRYSEKVRRKLEALEKSRIKRGELPLETWKTDPGRVAWAVRNAVKETQLADNDECVPATRPALEPPRGLSQGDCQIEAESKLLGADKDSQGGGISATSPTACREWDTQTNSSVSAHNLRSIGE